jgi:hypothetical protein
MDIDLTSLELDDLNLLLAKAEMELQTALLDGDSWAATKELRDEITEIRVAIHRATFPHDTADINQIRLKLMLSPNFSW